MGITLPSWNMRLLAPRPPPPPKRVLGRFRGQMRSVLINPQPKIWIDLTGRTTDGCGGKVYGFNPTTSAVAEHGVAMKSSTVAKEKRKGKRIVHLIEKRDIAHGLKDEEEKAKVEALTPLYEKFLFLV
jgi:hypothetical protein